MSCGIVTPYYNGAAVVLVLFILLVIVLSTFGFGW
ncbi:YjcZ family sporulation protein [Paenibacillus planticolens]|uniref:YjcZ family sporulation protein n=1 Tax=Paenibacillus planticolens TaxID=2654976 RepID=A0ABX1ZJA3_9BACL|nr:YjcZ family sporulation protein [Paenibacillus planticolens]NOV00160.1 YjcZ family sporulation protein [Paenibacillus planticolens]